jgi:DNA-binding YbaB/EbfC family protein
MFKELGQLAGILRQAPKIKEEMDKLHQRLGTILAEGDAGAGMVRVRVNGRMEMVACILAEDALGNGDRELVEDLIRAATNQALERVRQLVADETGKVTAGFGIPDISQFSSLMGR